MLFVTHDLGIVAQYCDRVAVMYQGEVIEQTTVADLFARPQHEYTRHLHRVVGRPQGLVPARDRRGEEPVLPAGRSRGPARRPRGSERRMSANVEIRDLVKHFPAGRDRVVHAVNGVTLRIRAGETLGLVGESGSGKSTVGRCALKLLKPTSGQVLFDGRDIADLNGGQTRAWRANAQMVFQDPFDALSPRMNVQTIIEEPLKLHTKLGSAERKARAIELLEQVGWTRPYLDRLPRKLSGGEAQRIAIARAHRHQPGLPGARRADVVAGPVGAGAASSTCSRRCSRELGLTLPADLARPAHGQRLRRPGGRDVPRHGRRDGSVAAGVRGSAAPVHAGAAVGDAPRRPDRPPRSRRAHGRDSQPDRPAARLPLRVALPAGARGLPDRPAAGSRRVRQGQPHTAACVRIDDATNRIGAKSESEPYVVLARPQSARDGPQIRHNGF